jgi:hypothetical protein
MGEFQDSCNLAEGGLVIDIEHVSYVHPEVRDWLDMLRADLPPSAARADGAHLDKDDLNEEFFAHWMSNGPHYFCSVNEKIQQTVCWFCAGAGDQADAAICRAYNGRQLARDAAAAARR